MPDLSAQDLRKALEVMSEVQCAPDLADFRRRVVSVRELMPCNVVGYNEVDAATGETRAVIDPPEAAPDGVEETFARVAHQHPVIAHFQATGDPGPHALSDFLSVEELHRLDLYREVFAPMAVEDQISLVLPTPPGVVVGLAINRPSRGFSRRDRELLRLIAPHLGRAFEAAQARASEGQALSALEEAACSRGRAVITLTGDDRIASGNPEALRWLADGEPGLSIGDRLPDPVAAWLADERAGDGGGVLRFPVPGGELLIRLRESDRLGERDLLLLELREDPVGDERLQSLGLSPREAEVMRLVVEGYTSRMIASELVISPATAEKHVANAYGKLGVRTRAAAVARVLEDG
jgi:DNA-binding CsgD family transcriptional regulator